MGALDFARRDGEVLSADGVVAEDVAKAGEVGQKAAYAGLAASIV